MIVDKTKNQVNVIFPYRTKYGIWCFDDEEVGLQGEPFVGSINPFIDSLVGGDKDCTAYISHSPIDNHTVKLTKVDNNGNYLLGDTSIIGWLCPATFKYFTGYPDNIYVRIEKTNQ